MIKVVVLFAALGCASCAAPKQHLPAPSKYLEAPAQLGSLALIGCEQGTAHQVCVYQKPGDPCVFAIFQKLNETFWRKLQPYCPRGAEVLRYQEVRHSKVTEAVRAHVPTR